MNTTLQVGQRLVELCKAGEMMKAIVELYADNVVSVESAGPPGKPLDTHGKSAVIGKSEWWMANHQIHSSVVDGPWPHDDQFIVTFDMDITAKAGPMAGQRFKMKEAGLYTVKDGKVVHEVFFYSMGG
jgi:ketosteroid isomerase-like protein